MKKIKIFPLISIILFSCSIGKNELDKDVLSLLFYRSGKITISGKAVKGNIKNGLVTVYSLNPDGTCSTSSLGTSTTNENGFYSISYYKTGGSVCVSVSPINGGDTRVFDEKQKKDISVTDPTTLQLSNIVNESSFTGSKKEGIFVSPMSKLLAGRVAAIKKESGDSADISKVLRRASKEIVIRFGLNKGFSSKNVKSLSDADFPELNEINFSNTSSGESKKYQAMLAGFSQMATNFKEGEIVTPKDIENVINAFADDFSDGKFDGVNSTGNSISIGSSGKSLGKDALSNQLLPAIQKFVQEGGSFGTGGESFTICATDLASFQFNDSATITYSESLTSTGTAPTTPVIQSPTSLTYPSTSYTFTNGVPIITQVPSVVGTITSCSVNPNLPAGLLLDNNICSISGTPSINSSTTNYTITATNSSGSTNTTLNITVDSNPPSTLVYSLATYTFNQNTTISTITPTYLGSISSCTASPALPSGLTISNINCSLSGTPSGTQASTAYTITAANSFGNTTANFNIIINSTPPSGLNYSGSPFIFTQNSSVGSIAPVFSGSITSCIASPTLPSGLTLSTNCTITGTPSVNIGATSYTITGSNSGGNTSTNIQITINTPPPSNLVYDGSPFYFTQNIAINPFTPTVTGSVTSFSSVGLPSGITLNTTTGAISGTPVSTTGGLSNVTITATNTNGSTNSVIQIQVNPTGTLYTFNGIRTSEPIANLTGWTQCYSDNYASPSMSLATIQSLCSKTNIMISCRPTGSSTLTIVAHAPRTNVFTITPAPSTVTLANGTNWYYDTASSWGFANAADSVNRSSCDTASSANDNQRLCWHTAGGNLNGGYRCGTLTSAGANYERIIYHAD